MNILALKELLRPVVGNLKDHCVDTKIPEFCRGLGLPIPEEGGSKRERMLASFDALNDSDLPRLAQTLLDRRILNMVARNQTQDLLWSDEPEIEIPKRYRRELARALQPFELFRHWVHFKLLLQEIFIIPDDLSALLLGTDTGILAEIYRHFVRNPVDADVEWLFEKLQAFDLSEPRFRRWLEGLVSSDVQIDVEAQFTLVTAMNLVLRTCGAEMRHVSDLGG